MKEHEGRAPEALEGTEAELEALLLPPLLLLEATWLGPGEGLL